jgi:hypothetical protein
MWRNIKESVLASKVRDYRWDPRLVASVLAFPNLQEPSPLEMKTREELTKGVPDLMKAAPCPPLKGLGEVKQRIAEPDYWFLDRAVPRIHANIYEEINILAFIRQEAREPREGDGSRMDLGEDATLLLLERVIRMKIDTLALLASMQIQRARQATHRAPLTPAISETGSKPIFSDKMLASDAKKAEQAKKESRRGFAYTR